MNATAGAWVSIDNWYDHNRDGKVMQADVDLVYGNLSDRLILLQA